MGEGGVNAAGDNLKSHRGKNGLTLSWKDSYMGRVSPFLTKGQDMESHRGRVGQDWMNSSLGNFISPEENKNKFHMKQVSKNWNILSSTQAYTQLSFSPSPSPWEVRDIPLVLKNPSQDVIYVRTESNHPKQIPLRKFSSLGRLVLFDTSTTCVERYFDSRPGFSYSTGLYLLDFSFIQECDSAHGRELRCWDLLISAY